MRDKHCEGHVHEPCGDCGHEHSGTEKTVAIRAAAAVCLFAAAHIPTLGETAQAVLLFAVIAVAGADIVYYALHGLFEGDFFSENVLMSTAAIAACIVGELDEGASVMLLFRIGELFQGLAVAYSRKRHPIPAEKNVKNSAGGRLIRRFSGVYTPIVLALALLTALSPLVFKGLGWAEAVNRALVFIVMACPCALVISIPLAYSAGIAAAAGMGVYLDGASELDALMKQLPPKPKTDEPAAQTVARLTRSIIYENIALTLGVKLAVIALGAFGISRVWFAVFADSGVALLAVLNCLRMFAHKAVRRNTKGD